MLGGRAKNSQLGSVSVVIVTLALVVLLLFLSLSAGLNHFENVHRLDHRARARDLAESAIHSAVSELCRNPGWNSDVQLNVPGGVISQGYLSFQSTTAHAWNIPHSTNNLEGPSAIPGDGLLVPRQAAHLVALGRYGGQRIQIETIFARPATPIGLCAQGPVRLEDVQLWGQPPDSQPEQPPQPNPWEPASAFTNFTGTNSMVITHDCDIFGSAFSVAQVLLEPGAVVRGETRSNSNPRSVPDIDLDSRWNSIRHLAGVHTYVAGRPLTSFCVVDGPLTVPGDLVLDGGVLAVHGNLRVTGKISGRGFILVTGAVQGEAGSALEADHRMALLCGGDLLLQGVGRNFFISGLLYSEGQVDVTDLTVHGALVQNDPTHSKTVILRRANLIAENGGGMVAAELPTVMYAQDTHLGSDGERMQLQLQSYLEPRNNTQLRFSGYFALHDDEVATGLWPPHTADRGWTINFSPPQATVTYGRGRLQNGYLVAGGGPPAPSPTTHPYDGSETALKSILRQVIEDQRSGNWTRSYSYTPLSPLERGSSNREKIDYYVNHVKGQAAWTRLDLNNLIPPIETVRFATWKEGAPSR